MVLYDFEGADEQELTAFEGQEVQKSTYLRRTHGPKHLFAACTPVLALDTCRQVEAALLRLPRSMSASAALTADSALVHIWIQWWY